MEISEVGTIRKLWTIRKFAGDLEFAQWKPFEVVEFGGNLLLNEGITEWLTLIIGGGGTAFNNANSYLAVGDGGPTALTGTITMTNGSTAVTGSGTAFTTELAVGDYIYVDAQKTQLGKVASITNNTALVLTANYGGTTASGAAASKILNEAASQTDLQASSNKLYKAMSATYPQVSGQTITWRSAFGSSDANFDWMEFSAANGSSGSAKNANRKVSAQGTKVSGQTWTLDLTITLS